MSRKLLILLNLALLFPVGLSAQESKENADFKLALNLYNDTFYDLALEQFRQFVSFYPSTQQGIEARYYLGLSQFQLKRYDEARLSFQNFALSYPDHPRAPEAWEKVGDAYLAEGNKREAALAYERIRTFHPRSRLASPALEKAASLFDAIGDHENALRSLRALTQEYSSAGTYDARLRLAELYAERDQIDAAMTEVRKVIDGSQEARYRGRALYLQAMLLQKRNRISEARSILIDVRKNYSGHSARRDALFALADIWTREGAVESAVSALREVGRDAAAGDTVRQRAYVRLGVVLEVSQRIAEAFGAFDSARKFSGPLASAAGFRAGRIREVQGDTLSAARLYIAAAADTSRTSDRLERLIAGVKGGRWLRRMDIVTQHATAVTAEFGDHPAAPRIFLLWADAELSVRGDAQRAEELYARVLQHPHGHVVADRAVLGQARCLTSLGYTEQAITRYDELLRAYPASRLRDVAVAEKTHLEMYAVRDREAGTEQLALLLGDVIGEQSRSTLSFRLAEISFAQLRNFSLARTQYRRALEGDLVAGSRPVAWMHLGRSLVNLAGASAPGSTDRAALLEEARQVFETLLREHPAHPLAQEAFIEIVRLAAESATDIRPLAAAARRADSLRLDGVTATTVWVSLGKAAARLRAYEESLRWFSSAYTASKNESMRGEILWRSGSLLAATGALDTARSVLSRSVNDHGVHPYVVMAGNLLADLESRKGNAEAVRSLRERLMSSFPYAADAASLALAQAEADFNAGQPKQAFARYGQYRSMVESDPFDPRIPATGVIYRMAQAARSAGEASTALRLFGEVISRKPDADVMLGAYNAIAALAEAQGDLSRASAAMSDATQVAESMGGDVTTVALQSADLLFRNEQYQEALTRYARLQSDASSDSIRTALEARIVVCYFRLNNIAEADKRATAFLRKNSKAVAEAAEFEFERGMYHVRQGRPGPARKHFEIVPRQYPKDRRVPEALYWVGRTYEIGQQPDSAAIVFDSLLRRYPAADIVPRVELSLGNVYYTLERWDKASSYYRRLVDDRQRAPDLVQYAMNNLILTYKELTLYDGALQLTREYISLYPDDPELINKRIDIGVLYQRLGYYDQSVVHLQNLLLTAPSDYEAELRYYIGEAYYYKGDHQQAILEFLKVPYLVIKRGPIDWVATSYYMAGQSYEKLSRFDQAIAMYQQIIDRRDIDAQFKTAAQREIDRVKSLVGQRN